MDSAEARHTASRSASAERFRRPATRSHLWNLPTNTLHNTCAWAGPFGRERPSWISRGSTNFGRILHISRSRISLLEATLRRRKDQAGNDPFESRSYGGEAGIRTLGRTLKALQRFSKPPPSASRPPHRSGKSEYTPRRTNCRSGQREMRPERRANSTFVPSMRSRHPAESSVGGSSPDMSQTVGAFGLVTSARR